MYFNRYLVFSIKRKLKYSINICFVLILLPLSVFSDQDSDMKWSSAEKEVGLDGYSNSYLDSIKTAKNVTIRSVAKSSSINLPFKKERLVFDGGWGFIRAGFAILSAYPDSSDSVKFIFSGKIVSNNFVSKFYKVRDYVKSINYADNLNPIFFEQHVREGRYKDNRWTLFDQQKNRVYYKYGKGEIESTVKPNIHNYLSVLYYLRTLNFAVGDTFFVRCYYHRKDYPIKFIVHKKEIIKVDAGTFKCFKIEPKLRGEGRGFTKKDQLVFWLSDDSKRLPVLIKAKINIGSLSARLLYYESE